MRLAACDSAAEGLPRVHRLNPAAVHYVPVRITLRQMDRRQQMKRIGVLAALSIGLLFSSMANGMPLKSWGFKGGYTAAPQIWQHDWISEDEISWRSGIHVSAYAEWFDHELHASGGMSHRLSVTTGLTYEQKGMKWTTPTVSIYDPMPAIATYDFRSHWLSIPIMAKYCIRGERAAPYLLAGPRLDICLSSKDELGPGDEYSDAVLGFSAGAGFEVLQLGLFFEFVYNHDQSWLWETESELTGDDIRVKNESFDISMGYRMNF